MSNEEKQFTERILERNIATEMRESFLDYSMSVIVSRALPDVRDGMKPVHRRILYAMNDLGMYADKAYKKSARIVGEVIGKYHPHGDSAVYGSMVRMAQEFSYRYMLVNGHGNFGSIDGDGAAAMRYTEAKMSKISMELMRDIQKDTIDFVDNYDGSEREPAVLPARFPNLLVNGSMGIAVGMTTNIPPHNLTEVIDAVLILMENEDIPIVELMQYLPGPDFPTGATILGRSGIKRAYETGNGSIMMRSKAEIIEHKNGKSTILVSEIPYQVNKAKMIERIAELVREKKIEGITDLRDESNREGIRIVIETSRDAQAEVILNNLYKQTSLQTSFSVNMLALVNGTPKILNVKEVLLHYLDHQKVVIRRRTQFDLNRAERRAHILEGLKIALDNIDEIIKIIRAANDDSSAQNEMMERFGLTEIQAKAILDMRLKRLTGLERQKIEDELNELLLLIEDLKDILAKEERILEIIRVELTEIRDNYGDARRTEILEGDFLNIEDEDLIPQEDVVITLTNKGYIKRVATDTYKAQNRGGKGIKAMGTTEEDFVEHLLTTNTHDYLLFFTNRGKVYRLKGYNIPEYGRTAKGLPIVNILPIEKDEYINAVIPIKNFEEEGCLMYVTRQGVGKRTDLKEFENIRANGKIAINLREDDELISVRRTYGNDEIIVGASNGKMIRFEETSIREMGRTASGVRVMRIDAGESIIGMEVAEDDREVLVVTEKGYGKRTPISEYRLQSRGGKGVKTINITERNGNLVALKAVNPEDNDDLMIITTEGIIIRTPIDQISQTGRATQGVRLIRVADDSQVSTIAVIPRDDEEEEIVEVTEEVIVETVTVEEE
ncbi:DNA gyrase subunit A [Culicoidibacter larvae]|uniref:DNA gyrase subunit A n=1 Tax=Culicoidibacter larvae TaxID=2579976 RepID=A0A5R8QGL4_9FIRM|nr:DNA gyrase subunit A [Culicoidibacter larvae]TLG77181.1 DNA gyrase subunit A [Culicoidibacter larvae]